MILFNRFRFASLLALVAVLLAFVTPATAAKKLNIITSTSDLAALTQEVGGDHVTIESLAKDTRTHTSSRRSPVFC
jgi:ABC-type Zn uptake system ZnuABC Zn-binding protein ZnuA